MIVSFADKETESLWETGRSRRLPPDILKRAFAKLHSLNAAKRIEDMAAIPGNRLESLGGELRGRWSIRINNQWRITFRYENGSADDVMIVDYH